MMVRFPFALPFIVALVVIVILVVVILRLRPKGHSAAGPEEKSWGATTPHHVFSGGPSIATGYEDLDGMLGGGIPEEFAVLILSQSYDERDLLIRKAIESNVSRGKLTFYMSADISKTQDLARSFPRNFYALNPMADKMGQGFENVTKIPDVGNLSDLNISSNEFLDAHTDVGKGNLLIIDLVTDILLRNKAVTTRKWLSEFIAKRKTAHFTIMATLDPAVASKEDTEATVGVFDGIIEIFERELQERSRRFLVVKKMYGHDYSDEELMLDRQKLLGRTGAHGD